MSYVIDKNHVALSASQDVRQICSSLFEDLGFNYFNYSRLFDDFSHTSLTSNPEWADFFYKYDYKNKFLYSEDIVRKLGSYKFLLWSDFKDNLLVKNLSDYFQTDHGITIIEKGNNYTDFYSFASPTLSTNTTFFLNNFNLLENFVYYFREKAAKLIANANSNKIYLPDIEGVGEDIACQSFPIIKGKENMVGFSRERNVDNFILKNEVKKYYTREIDFYLTKREVQSLFFYVQGYSQKPIAKFLDLSPRTVESYLDFVRKKTNINDRAGLVKFHRDFFSLSNIPSHYNVW